MKMTLAWVAHQRQSATQLKHLPTSLPGMKSEMLVQIKEETATIQ
jgi:hypothetical protein